MYDLKTKIAIDIVSEYIENVLFEPGRKWPTYEFETRVYSRWAANEIIDAIKNNPGKPTILVVQRLIQTFRKFSFVTEDTEQSLIFAIAMDTAEDIACLFL